MGLSFGRILGAATQGFLKGTADVVVAETKKRDKADELYARKAEYAREKAVKGKDDYRESITKETNNINLVSSFLENLPGSEDVNKRNAVAAQLVKKFPNQLGVLKASIQESMKNKGGSYTKAMLDLVLEDQLSVEDLARSIVRPPTPYKPPMAPSYGGVTGLLRRTLGVEEPTTAVDLETEKARGEGLMVKREEQPATIPNFGGKLTLKPPSSGDSAKDRNWFSILNSQLNNAGGSRADALNTRLQLEDDGMYYQALANTHPSSDYVASSQALRAAFIREFNAGTITESRMNSYVDFAVNYGGTAGGINKYVAAANAQNMLFKGHFFSKPTQMAEFIAKDRNRKGGPETLLTKGYEKAVTKDKEYAATAASKVEGALRNPYQNDFWKMYLGNYFILAPFVMDENVQSLIDTRLIPITGQK